MKKLLGGLLILLCFLFTFPESHMAQIADKRIIAMPYTCFVQEFHKPDKYGWYAPVNFPPEGKELDVVRLVASVNDRWWDLKICVSLIRIDFFTLEETEIAYCETGMLDWSSDPIIIWDNCEESIHNKYWAWCLRVWALDDNGVIQAPGEFIAKAVYGKRVQPKN